MRESAMQGQPLFQDWPSQQQEQGGLPRHTIEQGLQPVAEGWRHGPGFQVVQSVSDLPFRLSHPIRQRGFEKGTQGVFDPVTGQVYLVADNLPSVERAQQVLLHETVGHYGIRSLLGGQLDSYMDQVADQFPAQVQMAARSHGLDLNVVSERRRAAEEALAEMTEEGAQPTLLDRVLGPIKAALRSLGFKLQLTDRDLRNLIGRSYRYLRGSWLDGALGDHWESLTANWQLGSKESWAALRHRNPHEAGEAGSLVEDAVQAGIRPDQAFRDQHRARTVQRRLAKARKQGNQDEVAVLEAENRANQRRFQQYGPLRARYQRLSPQGQAAVRQALSQASADPLLATNEGSDPRDNPHLQSMGAKIGRPHRSPIQEFFRSRKGLAKRLQQGGLDKFYGLKYAEDIVEQRDQTTLTPQSSAYIAARMSTTPDAQMRVVLLHGPLMFKDGAATLVPNRKGLLDILDPIQHEWDLWERYMAGRRAARLWMEGRERLFTPEEIEAAIDLGRLHPEFEQAAQEWTDFNHQMLNFAESSGLIDPESRKYWEHMDYVPFYRVHEADDIRGPKAAGSLANQTNPIKRLGGGRSNINSVIENMLMNTAHLLTASMRNHAAAMAVENLGGHSDLMTRARPNFRKAPVPMEQVKRLLAEDGVDVDSLPDEAWRGMRMMYHWAQPDDARIMRVYRGGQAEYWEVHNQLLARAMGSLQEKPLGPWARAFRAPTQLLRWSVTRNPEFMLRNFLRDTGQAYVLSRDNVTPILSGVRELFHAHEEDPDMIAMWAAGGGFYGGYLHAQDPSAMTKVTRRLLRAHDRKRRAWGSPVKLMARANDKWESLSVRSENANRLAYYKAAKRAGKSNLEAAFEAKDMMDFSKRGDNPVVRFMASTVPFLNARLQGIDRLARYGLQHPVAFTFKGMGLALASVALWMQNKDDDRFNALETWQREQYWHFFAGGEHWVIPKPFEIGILFGNVPERLAELLYFHNREALDKSMRALQFDLENTLNFGNVEVDGIPAPVPHVLAPLAEEIANRSFFTNRPIVPEGEQELLPQAQYGPWTSDTMRAVGQATGMSPDRLEHLFRGYLGPIGMYALGATDVFARNMLDYPHPPSTELQDWPVLGALYRGTGPEHNTYYEKRFYELMVDADKTMNTARSYRNRHLPQQKRSLLTSHEKQLREHDFLRKNYRTIREINNQVEELYRTPYLDPEEKRRKIEELNRRKNEIFRRSIKTLESQGLE